MAWAVLLCSAPIWDTPFRRKHSSWHADAVNYNNAAGFMRDDPVLGYPSRAICYHNHAAFLPRPGVFGIVINRQHKL